MLPHRVSFCFLFIPVCALSVSRSSDKVFRENKLSYAKAKKGIPKRALLFYLVSSLRHTSHPDPIQYSMQLLYN